MSFCGLKHMRVIMTYFIKFSGGLTKVGLHTVLLYCFSKGNNFHQKFLQFCFMVVIGRTGKIRRDKTNRTLNIYFIFNYILCAI